MKKDNEEIEALKREILKMKIDMVHIFTTVNNILDYLLRKQRNRKEAQKKLSQS